MIWQRAVRAIVDTAKNEKLDGLDLAALSVTQNARGDITVNFRVSVQAPPFRGDAEPLPLPGEVAQEAIQEAAERINAGECDGEGMTARVSVPEEG